MDDGGTFREIVRADSGRGRPLMGFAGMVLAGLFLSFLGLLALADLLSDSPSREAFPAPIGVVVAVVLLPAGPGAVVLAVLQYRRERLARQLLDGDAPVGGHGGAGPELSVVEGRAHLVIRSPRVGSSFLVVAGLWFDLSSASLGYRKKARVLRQVDDGTVARVWFLPATDVTDAVLVRLEARPSTDAELGAELADLSRRYATAAAAGDVRPDRYQRFVDEQSALAAGLAPGASPKARRAALRGLDRFTRRLEQDLGESSGTPVAPPDESAGTGTAATPG